MRRRGALFQRPYRSLEQVGLGDGRLMPTMLVVLPKPKFTEPCNGCGFCCATELCELADHVFPGAVAPCPALEIEDGRTWCGMIGHVLINVL